MALARIIEDLGDGQYRIERNWAGREAVQAKIVAYNTEIAKLETQYDSMPETTEDEIFNKYIVDLQIKSLQKKIQYLTDNFPDDKIVTAWCADHTEGLSGNIGTIDIAGEFTADVNIRPAGVVSNAYSGARDGELYPGIALGPWTSLLNEMIYPGWQRFKPLHRYAWIVDGTIDYDNNTCVVAIKPTFSLMNYDANRAATGGGELPAAGRGARSSRVKNYNVNLGNTLGSETIEIIRNGIAEQDYASEFFVQNASAAHPGFIDFCERNPGHPIANVTKLNAPIFMTDEMYIQVQRICRYIDYFYDYLSDQSGYELGDYWNVMYDIGDPWYWIPSYVGEPLGELTFGDINLVLDDSGLTIGRPKSTIEEYYLWGGYSERNIELEFAANQLNMLGPRQKRLGDCEDFALTKMQAIIEAGIIPAANLQILLCYVVNAGYHAVLGIQTANRGFLISDQREYGQIWEIQQLSRTHMWESFSISTAAGVGNIKWSKAQVILKDVSIDYMQCGALAFNDGDEVIVEFTDQDWTKPKIIGFEKNPASCTRAFFFPTGIVADLQAGGRFNYAYAEPSDIWKCSGNMTTEKIPSHSAGSGFTGIGLFVGGSIWMDEYRYSSYTYRDKFDNYYGPFPAYAQEQIQIDNLLLYDVSAETWEEAQGSGIEAEKQNFKALSNGIAILHGGTENVLWRKEYWGGWFEWHTSWVQDPYVEWDPYGPQNTQRFSTYITHFQGPPGEYSSCQKIGAEVLSIVKLYQLSTDSWWYGEEGAERFQNACFLLNDKMYIVGGVEVGDNSCGYSLSQLAYEYGVFYQAADWYPEGPHEMDAWWLRRAKKLLPGKPRLVGIETSYAYDYFGDYWDEKQDFPYELYQGRGLAMSGKGFVGGGAVFEGDQNFFEDDLELQQYHWVGDNWVLNPIPYITMSKKGFWYNDSSDSWRAQENNPLDMGGFCGGEWGVSEINGKTKGMRIGKEHWEDSHVFVLDPITESWTDKGYAVNESFENNSKKIDYDYRRTFGSNEQGAEC